MPLLLETGVDYLLEEAAGDQVLLEDETGDSQKVLLENGSNLLLETGDILLLEDTVTPPAFSTSPPRMNFYMRLFDE